MTAANQTTNRGAARTLANRLQQDLGTDVILLDAASCAAYSIDNSRLQALPDAVALPRRHDDVVHIVRACHTHGIPLTARGRGTNTTGASVPSAGGIALSLERMQRILEYRPADRLLRCEAGALNSSVQECAAADRLFWAPDPTSAGYSSVGGNLACSAGGPRSVKYGTARDAALGLRAVDGIGRTLVTGCRTTKGVVGYDLTRLLIGSEGTLAVITEATLRLLPKPEEERLLRAAFRDVHSAAAAVARVMGQPAIPSMLEFMDGLAVRLAREHSGIHLPEGIGALLLMAVDGDQAQIARDIEVLRSVLDGDGLLDVTVASDTTDAASIWAARKALSPALRKLAPKKVNEDVAVPVSRLAELIDGVEKLSARHRLPIVNFGHAGNGNIHVNILADPEDAGQMGAIDDCLSAVFDLVLSLGGTLSGEHGVGIAKRDYVAREIDPETLRSMHAIKTLFDPAGILNPGKTLPALNGGAG